MPAIGPLPTINHQLNVSERLKQRIKYAESIGLVVRMEPLEHQFSDWCVVGGVPIILLDLSSTTSDQLSQLEQILQDFRTSRSIQHEESLAQP